VPESWLATLNTRSFDKHADMFGALLTVQNIIRVKHCEETLITSHGPVGLHMQRTHLLLLLTHRCFNLQVALPDGAAAAAAAGGLSVKPHFTLAQAAPGTPALHMKEVLMKLKNKAAAVTAAELTATCNGKKLQQQFGYDVLKITAVEQLQAPGTDRFTKHVELELPEGMTYTAGADSLSIVQGLGCCLLRPWMSASLMTCYIFHPQSTRTRNVVAACCCLDRHCSMCGTM